MKIMFICTGNICRSAMAEYLARKLSRQYKDNGKFKFFSSGLYAQNGDIPTENAINTMKDYNIDISNQRATNILDSNIEDMDYIFCMTKSHKMQTINMFPNKKDNIYMLKEFAENKMEDISDPWGCNIEVYKNCASEIEKELRLMFKKIEDNK